MFNSLKIKDINSKFLQQIVYSGVRKSIFRRSKGFRVENLFSISCCSIWFVVTRIKNNQICYTKK